MARVKPKTDMDINDGRRLTEVATESEKVMQALMQTIEESCVAIKEAEAKDTNQEPETVKITTFGPQKLKSRSLVRRNSSFNGFLDFPVPTETNKEMQQSYDECSGKNALIRSNDIRSDLYDNKPPIPLSKCKNWVKIYPSQINEDIKVERDECNYDGFDKEKSGVQVTKKVYFVDNHGSKNDSDKKQDENVSLVKRVANPVSKIDEIDTSFETAFAVFLSHLTEVLENKTKKFFIKIKEIAESGKGKEVNYERKIDLYQNRFLNLINLKARDILRGLFESSYKINTGLSLKVDFFNEKFKSSLSKWNLMIKSIFKDIEKSLNQGIVLEHFLMNLKNNVLFEETELVKKLGVYFDTMKRKDKKRIKKLVNVMHKLVCGIFTVD